MQPVYYLPLRSLCICLSYWGRNIGWGVLEKAAEDDVWALDRWCDRGVQKTTYMRSLMTCTSHKILSTWSNRGEWDGLGMWHVLGERRDAYEVMIGKPEVKRTHRRLRCRREDNIKMYLQEIGWESVDWIGVAQDWDKWWVVVNKVLNIWVVLNAGDFFEQLRHY